MTTDADRLIAEARKHHQCVMCNAPASLPCPHQDPLLPQLADALVAMRAEFAATLRVVRQGLDPADPTYKIATEAIERLETPDCPARPMEPGT